MSAPPSNTSVPSPVLQRTTAMESSSPAPASPQFDRQRSSSPPQMQFGNSPPPTTIPSPTCHSAAAPSSPSQPRSRVRPRTPPVTLRSPTLNPILSNSSRRRLRLRRSSTVVPSRSSRSHRSSSPHAPAWSRVHPSMPPDVVMRPPPSGPPFTMASVEELDSNSSQLLHNRHLSLAADTFTPIYDSQVFSSAVSTPNSPIPPAMSAPPISGRIPHSSHAHAVDDRPHYHSTSHASIYTTPAPSVLPTPASLANINTPPVPQHPRTPSEMATIHTFPFSSPPHPRTTNATGDPTVVHLSSSPHPRTTNETGDPMVVRLSSSLHPRTTNETDGPIVVPLSPPPSGSLRLPPPHTRTNALEELIAVLEGRGPLPQRSHIISRTNLPSTSQPQYPNNPQPISNSFPSSTAPPSTSAPSTDSYRLHQTMTPHNRLPPSISLPVPASVPQPQSSRRDLAALFGVEPAAPDSQNNRNIFGAAFLNGFQGNEGPTQLESAPPFTATTSPMESVPQPQSVPTLLGRSTPLRRSRFIQLGTPRIVEPPLPPLTSQAQRPVHQSRPMARPLPLHHHFPDSARATARRRQFHSTRLPSLVSNDFNNSYMRPIDMEPEIVPSERSPRREIEPFSINVHSDSDEDDQAAAPRTTLSNIGPSTSSAPNVTPPDTTTPSGQLFTRGHPFRTVVQVDGPPIIDLQQNETRAGPDGADTMGRNDAAERAPSFGVSRLLPLVDSVSRRAGVSAGSIHPFVDDDFEVGMNSVNLPRGWVPNTRDSRLPARLASNSTVRRFMLDDGNEGFFPESVEDYMNTLNNVRMRSRGRGRGSHASRGMPPRSRSGLRMNIPRSPMESMLRRSEVRAMVAGREFGVPCGLFEYSVRGRPSLTPRIEWPEVVLISDENVKPRAPVLDLMSENNVQWCVRVGPLGNGEGDGRRGYLAFIHGLIEGGFAIELNTQGGCIYFWALSFPPYGECLLGVFRPTVTTQAASTS